MDEMDECSPCSAVAIHERVNGFEPRMRNGGLGDSGETVVVRKRTEVRHEFGDILGRWRNEGRRAGVVGATPDPVLDLSIVTSVFFKPGSDE